MSQPNWSSQEDQKLIRAWLMEGRTQVDIAKDLEKSTSAVSRRIKHFGLQGERGNVSLYTKLTGDIVPVIKPVKITLKKPPTLVPDSADYVSLHYSDVHFPFQDQRALDVLYAVAEALKPKEIYMQGDLIDFWQISRHRIPDEKKMQPHAADLQSNLNTAAEHLALMSSLTGARRKVYMLGNHEDRLDRLLSEMYSDFNMSMFLKLDSVRRVFDIAYLLDLDNTGWEVIKYISKPLIISDSLALTHGYYTTQSVAKRYLQLYGLSTLYGHDHRLQTAVRRTMDGHLVSQGLGCLCTLDPYYNSFTDWHNGFALVFWRDRDFTVQSVPISDGKACVLGKWYG